MQSTTLSFANLHDHGQLFADMLRVRHQLFIQQKRWDLPEALGMEYDQYDTPASRWVVVHDGQGEVLGGNRLTPTTAKCGIYSYMLRDAQRGLLESIPSNILDEEAPVRDEVWENTRVFVSPNVKAAKRPLVRAAIWQELLTSAKDLGASSFLAITSHHWPRWAHRIGMDVVPAGPVVQIDGESHQAIRIRVGTGK